MKTAAAIIETDVAAIADQVIETHRLLREAETAQADFATKAARAGEAAQMRRLELGKLLLRARTAYPQRGPKAKGWGEFLEKVGLEQSTAWRYMELVNPGLKVVPEPTGDFMQPATVHETGADPGPSPDRDTWCTPKWITDAIGRFDLDPCGNERSHVNAELTFDLARRGEDGLKQGPHVQKRVRAFINPPYSDVLPWIEAYKHTRFCFLLKFDPSTKWCQLLLQHTELVLFPRGTRIEFEAPPGVDATANQFPHGLFYARARDATDAIKALCFPGWTINRG